MNKKDINMKRLFGNFIKILVLMSLLFFPMNAIAVEKVSVTSRTPITMSLKKQQSLSIQGTTIHNAKSVSIGSSTNQTFKEFATKLSCKAPAKKGAKSSCSVKLTLTRAVPLGKYTLSIRDARRQLLAVGRFEVKADAAAVAKAAALKRQQAAGKKKQFSTKKQPLLTRKKGEVDKTLTASNKQKAPKQKAVRGGKQNTAGKLKGDTNKKRNLGAMKNANKAKSLTASNKQEAAKRKAAVAAKQKAAALRRQQATVKKKEFPAKLSKGKIDKKQTLDAKQRNDAQKRNFKTARKSKGSQKDLNSKLAKPTKGMPGVGRNTNSKDTSATLALERKKNQAAKMQAKELKETGGKPLNRRRSPDEKAQETSAETTAKQTADLKNTTTTRKDKATEITKKTKRTTNDTRKKPNGKGVQTGGITAAELAQQRRQGDSSSGGVSTQAFECTVTPSLSTQGVSSNNVIHPGDPNGKLEWPYDGCVTYFQMCFQNVGQVFTNSPDPTPACSSYEEVHKNARYYRIPRDAGFVLSGNEKLFALRACYTGTGSQNTECGNWSNSIALKVALPTAVLIAPGTVGSFGNRTSDIPTRQPTFSWQSVSGANRYKLVLHTPGPGGPRHEFTVTGTSTSSVVIPADLGNQVVWFVKACAGSGSGEFCSYLAPGNDPISGYDIWQHQHILNLPPATGGGATTVTFNDLKPAFEHSKCQNCHSVAIDNYEIGGGADGIGLPVGHQNVGPSTNCMSCHGSFLTQVNGISDILLDWQASLPSHVFAGASPAQLCAFGQTGAGGHDAEEHLTEDRLILWAIYNGAWTGHGSGLNAVNEWKEAVHDWASTGFPCN
jgi:hypothetical protein